MISLVVFDMAGTTVNENNVVYKTLLKSINDFGNSFTLEEVLEIGAGKDKYKAIVDILQTSEKKYGNNESLAKQIHRDFQLELKKAYNQLDIQPCEGAEELFQFLRNSGIKVVLNTGYDQNTADNLIRKLNWSPGLQFDLLVTADNVVNGRPAPDMIFLAMSELHISSPAEVVKIGDSIVDIEEGQAANCGLSVGITTGAQKRSQLETANPDFVVDSLLDFRTIIQKQITA